MAAPDRPPAEDTIRPHWTPRLPLLALLAGACIAGCSSTPPPVTPPPQPISQVAPDPGPPAPPEPTDTAAASSEKTADPTVMVIDPGGDASLGRPNLAAASRAERQRRATADEPVAVINNKNLAEYAVGELTFVEEAPGAATTPPEIASEEGATTAADEARWRSGALERRARWKAAVDQILESERRAEELRNQFYREDDPHRRDGLIKPQWDRALELLEESRRSATEAEAELQRFLAAGAAAGALPGWLREGVELEPEVRPYGPPAEDAPVVGEPQGAPSAIGEPTTVPEGHGG